MRLNFVKKSYLAIGGLAFSLSLAFSSATYAHDRGCESGSKLYSQNYNRGCIELNNGFQGYGYGSNQYNYGYNQGNRLGRLDIGNGNVGNVLPFLLPYVLNGVTQNNQYYDPRYNSNNYYRYNDQYDWNDNRGWNRYDNSGSGIQLRIGF
jgi:hypothetical protein